jgi:predicted transcriptional regulator YheO
VIGHIVCIVAGDLLERDQQPEVADSDWARPYEPAAVAVVRLFYPHVEAVIHDVERDIIVRIWNPMSARGPGDPSLLDAGQLGQLGPDGVSGPYTETGLRGEEVSSVSAVIAGGRGLLCLNFDRSVVNTALAGLRSFALGVEPRPAALFERDWREELNSLVHRWCQENGVRPAHLSPGDRRALVAYLDGQGVFQVRRAASHLAAILSVCRATVYSTLQSARAKASGSAA